MPVQDKAVRRRLREIVGLGHERALARRLGELERDLARWRAGEIDAFAAGELVSRAARDVRELDRDYEVRNATLELAAAGAIVHGLVTADEAGPDVMRALEHRIRDLIPTDHASG